MTNQHRARTNKSGITDYRSETYLSKHILYPIKPPFHFERVPTKTRKSQKAYINQQNV